MDNSVLPGTGDTYASDDIGGVKFPRVKLIYGSDGNNSGDVATDNPLPVALPSGITLSTPSGIRVTVPSLMQVSVPSLVNVGLATGLIGIQAPSGLALWGGTGAAISSSNPLPVSTPSLAMVALVASGLRVDANNPLPVSSPSLVNVSLATGIFQAVAPSGLRTFVPSLINVGFATGIIQVVAPSGLAVTGNLSASIGTGTFVGITASGLPITTANPLPVTVVSGGDGSVQGVVAHGSIATGVQDPLGIGGFAYASAQPNVDDGDAVNGWFLPNGSQVTTLQSAGTLLAAGMGASSAGLRTAPATDGVWPVSQGTGAQFLATVRQATGSAFAINQATGAPFNVWAQQATGTVQLVGQPTGQVFPVSPRSVEAHGFNPTGGPFLQGMQARGADPIAVASGAVAQAYGDTLGKQVVMPGAPHSLLRSGYRGVQGTGSTDLIAAPGSGFALVVTSIKAVNSSPTYASEVVIHDGVATLSGGMCAAQGGGFAEEGGMYPLFVASSNAPIRAVNLASGADIKVRVSGYRISNP